MPGEGTKSDMERIGLFSEMEYITVGDKYVSHHDRPFNEAASKNKQMLPGGSKEMSDLQAGYFEPRFVRIFEGEGYANLNQMRRKHMMQEAKKNLGKAFLPTNGEKKSCGVGSYYGTIGGPVPFFSAQAKPRDKYEAPGKNLYTSPGKKGTGYGYANVTIGKQFTHSTDVYDAPKLNYKKESEEHHRLLKGGPFKLNLYPREYFDTNPYFSEKSLPPIKKAEKKEVLPSPFKPSSPGKKAGGMKAGTFDPYPSHSTDPYLAKSEKPSRAAKVFHPPGGPKSRPVESIMTLNVKRTNVLGAVFSEPFSIQRADLREFHVCPSECVWTRKEQLIAALKNQKFTFCLGIEYEELQDYFNTILLGSGRQVAFIIKCKLFEKNIR